MSLLATLDEQAGRIVRRRNWRRKARRMQSELDTAYRRAGVRSISQVHQLLRMLRPHQTGLDLIRVGPDHDGGYILPDDFDGVQALFSPGVDDVIGFDHEIADMGIDTHLLDASVEEPSNLRQNMTFSSKFIGPKTEGTFVTMDDWVNQYAPGTEDLILQMDVEGAEYDVLPTMSDALFNRFRMVIVEYHDLHHAIQPEQYDKIKASWSRFSRTHSVAHVHINNCAQTLALHGLSIPTVVEVTYLRNDRLQCRTGDEASIPHPLDRLNNPILPEPQRAEFWRRGIV